MTEFFKEKDLIYSLRSGSIVSIPAAITSKFGINSIHFRAALLWNTLPKGIKESKSISQFKININKVRLDVQLHCTTLGFQDQIYYIFITLYEYTLLDIISYFCN